MFQRGAVFLAAEQVMELGYGPHCLGPVAP